MHYAYVNIISGASEVFVHSYVFAISELLLDGWSDWFKSLHGVTQGYYECY